MISRLYVLDLGSVRDVGVPIAAYLIELTDGRHVLVDTGCSRELVDDPESPFAAVHVRTRLAELDVTDIAMVIVSHLDPDHCGAHDEFPGAEFVIQRAQYEHARSSGLHRYEWMRRHWDDPRLRYRCVDGDTELLPGLSVIECGGHVPGHQAVLVDLPRTGRVMLSGDAWLRDSEPDTRQLSAFDLDGPQTRAAQRKLMRIASDQGVRLVIHNHDLAQWPTLKHAPDTYQ
jgi:N-acyl homoserine lactone hydrolase